MKNIKLLGHMKSYLTNSVPVYLQRRGLTAVLDCKYSAEQKEKILRIINEAKLDDLARYDITKNRIKSFNQWRCSNGKMSTLSEIELVEGFSEKTAKKFFNSILEGKTKTIENTNNRIKGQILHPQLSTSARQNCQTVTAVYITAGSICWCLFKKDGYELLDWKYYGLNNTDGAKMQITDILEVAWEVSHQLPRADVFVMKAAQTTLRAAGSDPNNPKVLAVNLQKAQLTSMIVALINAQSYSEDESDSDGEGSKLEAGKLKHKVYFLRPTLPYRLYGTLVGNEKVSTDHIAGTILQNATQKSSNNSQIYVPQKLKNMFESKKELERDMLGHCLLLGLTFMDLCIYKNHDRINELLKNNK